MYTTDESSSSATLKKYVVNDHIYDAIDRSYEKGNTIELPQQAKRERSASKTINKIGQSDDCEDLPFPRIG